MPIYEYRCEEGHVFETFQSITDEALTACTECGAPAQRVLNAPAIHFKGSGFYTTDYGPKKRARVGGGPADRDSGSSGSNGSASDSASTSDSGSSGSSETKPKSDSAKSAA